MEAVAAALVARGLNPETAATYAEALCRAGIDSTARLNQATEQNLRDCGVTNPLHLRAALATAPPAAAALDRLGVCFGGQRPDPAQPGAEKTGRLNGLARSG